MALEIANVIHAIGLISGGDGIVLPTLLHSVGLQSVARTAPGVYQVTTDISIDWGEAVCVGSVPAFGGTPAEINARVLTDGVIEVVISADGVGIDPPDFALFVLRFISGALAQPALPPLNLGVPNLPYGFSAKTFWKSSGPVPIVGGATVPIPGPAAGFLRIFSLIEWTADNPALAAVVDGTVQPAALRQWRAQSSLLSTIQLILEPLVLTVGESVDVTNTSANNGTMIYAFLDIADPGNVTLVRTTYTAAAPVVIIPAPAAGLQRVWLKAVSSQGLANFIPRAAVNGFNDDTVAHQILTLLAGVVASRSGSVAAAALSVSPAGSPQVDMAVTSVTGDLALQAVTGIVTNPITLIGAYQTFSQ